MKKTFSFVALATLLLNQVTATFTPITNEVIDTPPSNSEVMTSNDVYIIDNEKSEPSPAPAAGEEESENEGETEDSTDNEPLAEELSEPDFNTTPFAAGNQSFTFTIQMDTATGFIIPTNGVKDRDITSRRPYSWKVYLDGMEKGIFTGMSHWSENTGPVLTGLSAGTHTITLVPTDENEWGWLKAFRVDRRHHSADNIIGIGSPDNPVALPYKGIALSTGDNSFAGYNMFEGTNLATITGSILSTADDPDRAQVTSVGDFFFYRTFDGHNKITSYPNGSFDTSKITTVGDRFFSETFTQNALTSLPAGSFNISQITTVGEHFFYHTFQYQHDELTNLPVGSFDTSNITTVGEHFFYYTFADNALTSLPDGSFKLNSQLTSVENSFFDYAFANNKLEKLPIGSFNTNNIISVGNYFFANAFSDNALTSLPVGSFKLNNLTSAGDYFFYFTFSNNALIALPVGSFDTSNITSASSDFFYSTFANNKLEKLPVGSFDISNLTSFGSYPFNCTFLSNKLTREAIIQVASTRNLSTDEMNWNVPFLSTFYDNLTAIGLITENDIPILKINPRFGTYTFEETNLKTTSANYENWGLGVASFPTAALTYMPNSGQLTSGNVTVTLTASEPILQPLGRSGSATGTVFTKTFSNNTGYHLTITSIYHITGTVMINITNIDAEAPIITLNGSEKINLLLNGTYTELGANWTDNVDGSGTINSTNDSVNVHQTGSYTLTYIYTDQMGNTGIKIRTVNVFDPKGDEDGDGYTNEEEIINGTDPEDKNNTPQIGGKTNGGGKGGSLVLSKDHCPDGDFSPSYYDGTCGNIPTSLKNEHNAPDNKPQDTTPNHNKPQDTTPNPSPDIEEETTNVYQWAYAHHITTQPTVQEADPNGSVIRSHLAKMIVNYMENVLNKKPDTTRDCSALAASIQSETEELQTYIILACQYGIMGVHTDGSALSDFMPHQTVSRAEFGTVLSRILWGDTYNDSTPYYEKHLQALKEEGIMTQISNPEEKQEQREWVWSMLMKKDEEQVDSKYENFISKGLQNPTQ